MKKVLILSLLLVFCFCLPVLAAEELTLGESKLMVFKYKLHDKADIGGTIVELNVYDKQDNKKLTSDEYTFEGLTSDGVQIKKDSRGQAFSPTSQKTIKVESDGYAYLKITYMKGKDLVLKLKPSDKKVFVFGVQQ